MVNVAVPSSYKTAGAFIERRFAVGPTTTGSGEKTAYLVMPMTSAGSWTANTVYAVEDLETVKDGAGSRSPLAIAVGAYFDEGGTGPLYALPYAETSGSSSAADGYVEISGTATARGVLSLEVAGKQMSAAIQKDDTDETVAELVVELVSAATGLPCTASRSGAKTTLTAAIDGESQNDVIRFHAEVTSGIGLSVTLSGDSLGTGAGNAGADGSTSEQDNLESALSAITSERAHLLGVSVIDSTDIGEAKTHVDNMAAPEKGNFGRFVAASVDSKSAIRTLATGLNFERGSVVGYPDSPVVPAHLVGATVAKMQDQETIDPSVSIVNRRFNSVPALPRRDQGSKLDGDDINDLLRDGVTPIVSSEQGARIAKAVTTRSKDSTGNYDDLRVWSTHTVATTDAFGDDMAKIWVNEFQGKKLRDDKKNSDGTVDTTQNFSDGVITPSIIKGRVFGLVNQYDTALNRIQEADTTKNQMVLRRDTANPNRVEALVAIRVIDSADQFSAILSEVTPG